MARVNRILVTVWPLLATVWKVTLRELRTLNSVGTNNFFLFSLLLMQQPSAAVFLFAVVGLLIFFPLSADPMKKIPVERLALLPLTQREHVMLRIGCVFLSPAVWLIAAITLWGGARFRLLSLQLLGLLIVANVAAFWGVQFLEKVPRGSLLRHIPQFPGPQFIGRTGGLIRKNIRELAYLLDPYVALVLSICGVIYRFTAANPQAEANEGITMLVVLAMSTTTQRLFALDFTHGMTRYRLLPLRGWQILLAKDLAFLIVLTPLVAALAPMVGIAAGLIVLAFGHQPSVMLPVQQARWRFVSGASITHAILQTGLMFGAGTMTARYSYLTLAVCASAWAISLILIGWQLDKRQSG